MLVKELIELLQKMPQDMEVKYAAKAHDYWKTTLALDVAKIEIDSIYHNSYFDEYALLSYDDIGDDLETEDVVILS